MKNFNRILAAAVLMGVGATAAAQNSYSGYFLDGYTYRFQMNPAFGNEKNFVSMPVLGNMNISLNSDISLSSLVYNVNGKTVLFTHPEISVAEVLKGFKDVNDVAADVKLGLMSAGFKAFGGYNTISLNLRANASVGLPKTMISLMKEGISNSNYDLSDLNIGVGSYAEISLGHSHDIEAVPGLRVGANLKFLLGLAYAESDIRQASLDLGEDSWKAATDADIYFRAFGAKFSTDVNDEGRGYVSGLDFDGAGFSPAGFGMAIDLGAVYKFRDFTFSAAVNDLGFINYGNVLMASTDGVHNFSTDSFVFDINDDESASLDDMMDDLAALYEFKDKGVIGNRKGHLDATVNVGVDYALPVCRNLHFGLLNTTVFRGGYTCNTLRLSANVAPVNFFSANVNAAVGTFGPEVGWMLSFHTTGFNFFVGMDRMFGKLTNIGIPVNPNAHMNLGINFLF